MIKLPQTIKNDVIHQWVKGVPRDQIARNNCIAFGSVSNIIKEARQGDIPDIDLLRELALALKREDWDLSPFASSRRLIKLIHNLGMFEEQVEDFLEQLSVFFYRNDVRDVPSFLLQFEVVSDLVKNLDVSIYDIKENIMNSLAKLDSLNHEKDQIKQEIKKLRSHFVELIKYVGLYCDRNGLRK